MQNKIRPQHLYKVRALLTMGGEGEQPAGTRKVATAMDLVPAMEEAMTVRFQALLHHTDRMPGPTHIRPPFFLFTVLAYLIKL